MQVFTAMSSNPFVHMKSMSVNSDCNMMKLERIWDSVNIFTSVWMLMYYKYICVVCEWMSIEVICYIHLHLYFTGCTCYILLTSVL